MGNGPTEVTQTGEPMRAPQLGASPFLEVNFRNMTAIMKSWLAVAEGANAIVAKQQELAQATVREMADMLGSYRATGKPHEAMVRQVELAKKTFDAAVANSRDIVEVIRKSQNDVASVVRERVGAEGAAWLTDPTYSAKLVDFVASKLAITLDAVDKSYLPSLIGEHVRKELEHVEFAPLAAGLLSTVIEKGRQQQALDALLDRLEGLVSDFSSMEAVRERIRAKLPALFNLYSGEPIIMNKMIDAIKTVIAEIRADRGHPVRTELDGYLTALIERLRNSPEFAGRLDAYWLDLLERPELGDLAAQAWSNLRDFLVRDVHSEDSLIRRQLERILADIGAHRTAA